MGPHVIFVNGERHLVPLGGSFLVRHWGSIEIVAPSEDCDPSAPIPLIEIDVIGIDHEIYRIDANGDVWLQRHHELELVSGVAGRLRAVQRKRNDTGE